MSQSLENLRSIKSFPALVKYLRNELDWEFEAEEIEDLTYGYDAAEFSLDARAAAQIQEIKQLRPLVDGQPWGIFYLNFSAQKLSVTALRGVLRGLMARKRLRPTGRRCVSGRWRTCCSSAQAAAFRISTSHIFAAQRTGAQCCPISAGSREIRICGHWPNTTCPR